VSGIRIALLMAGVRTADALLSRTPARLAYGLADFGGDVHHRLASGQRALVRANLERVVAAGDRPVTPAGLDALVRRAFIEQARYYLEILRAPHYRLERVTSIVKVDDSEALRTGLLAGPAVVVGSHLGSGEPGAMVLAAWKVPATIPIEEIEPRELFEFIMERRVGGHATLLPVSRSQRPMLRRLRDGGVVGIVADRDVGGGGLPVELFGHPTTVPAGPATLALLTGASVWVARCLRIGHDRFRAAGVPIPFEPTGDRKADILALTRLITAQIERDIARAPAQWWGTFQPIWTDLDPPRS